jgi:hypothetical protein
VSDGPANDWTEARAQLQREAQAAAEPAAAPYADAVYQTRRQQVRAWLDRASEKLERIEAGLPPGEALVVWRQVVYDLEQALQAATAAKRRRRRAIGFPVE